MPTDEQRPLRAIETAEAWTRGEATREQVEAAAYAADCAAANNFATYGDCAAARAAHYAARAAHCAALLATAIPADAAYCAAAANVAAHAVSLAHSADLVRSVITWDTVRARLIEIVGR